MKKVLHLDFETYCELDIKKVGAHKYCEHSSFEVLCFAWAFHDEIELWEPSQGEWPEKFIDLLQDPQVMIAAWNAQFEYLVLKRSGHKVPIHRFIDVMALATRMNYPRALDKAAPATGVTYKAAQTGIKKCWKPRKPTQAEPWTRYTPENNPTLFKEMYDYCKQDVVAERMIYNFLPNQQLSPFEHQVWVHTAMQNNRGILIDRELVEAITDVLETWKSRAEKQLSRLTNGVITTGNQRNRFIDWCAHAGVKLPDLTEATVTKTINHPKVPDEVKKVLKYRQALSKTSTAKFNKMLESVCQDGRIRGNLIYSPTVTGRFAGAGLQIHNLPRRKEDDPTALINAFLHGLDSVRAIGKNVMELASKLIRPCLIPPDGYDWIVSDYSSIEYILLLWAAGETKAMREFDMGLDPYRVFASEKFRVPYEAVTDHQRFHGKTAILGLGYQMGDKTYVETAKGYGLDITREESIETVSFYRNRYSHIKRLWYRLYNAALEAVDMPGRVTEYRGVKFTVKRGRLLMRLHSGRLIAYNKPDIEIRKMPWTDAQGNPKYKPVITFEGINPYTNKWSRLAISPGRLTENLIQALGREVLVVGLINAERAGYTVVGSVHDEGMAYVKEGQGSVEEFNHLMCDMPSWADGMPLKAEGWRGKRYKKT